MKELINLYEDIPENLLEEAFLAEGVIRDLKEQVKSLKKEIERWTDHQSQCLDMAEERGELSNKGYQLVISEASRSSRVIIPEKFEKLWPEEFKRICNVQLGLAEAAVGGRAILDTSGCVVTETTTHKVRTVRYRPDRD